MHAPYFERRDAWVWVPRLDADAAFAREVGEGVGEVFVTDRSAADGRTLRAHRDGHVAEEVLLARHPFDRGQCHGRIHAVFALDDRDVVAAEIARDVVVLVRVAADQG